MSHVSHTTPATRPRQPPFVADCSASRSGPFSLRLPPRPFLPRRPGRSALPPPSPPPSFDSLRVFFLLSLLLPVLGRYHHIYTIRVGFCEPAQSRSPAGFSRGVFHRHREAGPQPSGHTPVKGTGSHGVHRLRQDGGQKGKKRTAP